MLEYLSAFGIGAVVSVLVQLCLTFYKEKRTLQFQEKKEAYLGLLNAYHQAAVFPSEVNSKNFALWQMRCELVGNASVRKAIDGIVASNDNSHPRSIAHEELKNAMRKDLRITK